MTVPLYNGNAKPDKCAGNHGLWFERFYDQYDPRNWDVLKPTSNNDQMGNTFWLLHHFNKKVGVDDALENHAKKQRQLTESLNGKSIVFKSCWHFVTGMGNPHPVENGFAWHPTLGVPYLTGAAVKGIVRTYIENHLDENNARNPNKEELLLEWFGSTDKNPRSEGYQSQAGGLIFFDALPIEQVSLGVDVMTPHMGKWYEQGKSNAGQPETTPADWHDPVPVSFLVAKDITLLFSFSVRQYPISDESSPKRAPIDLSAVLDVLQRALEHEGAGGKTTTGYGGMLSVEKLELQEQERRDQEALVGATLEEGVYLKRDARNGALFIERGKRLGSAAATRAEGIVKQLTPEETVAFNSKGAVKVNAYVNKSEIVKITSWTK